MVQSHSFEYNLFYGAVSVVIIIYSMVQSHSCDDYSMVQSHSCDYNFFYGVVS